MSCGSAVVRGRVGRLCCSFEGCGYLLSNKVYVQRVGGSSLRAVLGEKFARTTEASIYCDKVTSELSLAPFQ